MIYCYDKELPFNHSKKEMKLCKIYGNGILYDREKEAFTDFNGAIVNIEGKVVLPRTGVDQLVDLNNKIVECKGIPIVSNKENEMILNWPLYYKSKRKIEILKGKDLINSNTIKRLKNTYGKNIFLKTKDKNFSDVIPLSLLKDRKCVFYKALGYHLEDDFIVSEKIDIASDIYGLREYRCFVINGEVYNISRFTTEVYHHIEPAILNRLNEINYSLKDNFPNTYTVDLFEYQKDGESQIDVVEFNPLSTSGLYLYNSVLEKSNDLVHVDIERVAPEFSDEKCSYGGKMVDYRGDLYENSRSFASDLLSIYLTGDIGVLYADSGDLTLDEYKRHDSIMDTAIPITDDDFAEQIFRDDPFEEFTCKEVDEYCDLDGMDIEEIKKLATEMAMRERQKVKNREKLD